MVQVMREFDLVSKLKGSLKDTKSILELVRPASRQLLWIFVGCPDLGWHPCRSILNGDWGR